MRIRNSIINISTGIGSQVILTLLSFASRTIFLSVLGVEYLGINGLFTNILGMLSLAEAGIGSAIIYNLYKPVADGNKDKIYALIKFYQKAYIAIGMFVLILGLAFLPFLNYFIKDSNIENVHLIYVLFLLNTTISYLFTHKISLLNVNQKGYIVTSVYSLSAIISTFLKIGVLVYTQNYILYVILDILITLITSILLTVLVNRMYPYLRKKMESKLDYETKENIKKNVKAIVLHNIGGYAVFGTDNLIIASFVSVTAVGLYSNYYMIMNICRTFINQFFDNIIHSVGNLVAQESNKKIHSIFKVTMLFNFWIYSFFVIFLFNILEPFIETWIGPQFLLSKGVLIILLINFYVSGMRRSISMVKTTSGIFHEDRFAPFFEAVINLGASLLLVHYLGIIGVFIGTLISTIAVPFWVAPFLVYKKVFLKPVFEYFRIYFYYTLIGLGALLLTSRVSALVLGHGILSLFFIGVLCIIIPNVIFVSVFYKTNEFKYLIDVISSNLKRVSRKYRTKQKENRLSM